MSWEKVKGFFSTITLEKILPVLLVLVVSLIVARLILRLFDRSIERSKLDRTIFTFLKTVMRIVIYALVILIAVGSLGIDVSSLIALLSVVSLAISLAVQNTLANVVGGVSLLATRPFRVGDFVQIGSDCGTVEEISMSYTRIETVDGKHIYIPNSDAASARICNYSDNGKRRVEITVSASYSDAIENVKQALLKAGDHPKRLTDEIIEVYVNNYLDSGVEYLLRLWTADEDYAEVRFAVIENIKHEFDAAGISMPFPQMDVHLDKLQ